MTLTERTVPSPLGAAAAPLVLCVDDDADIRRVLRHTLETAGLAFAEAASGPQALEWVARHGLPQAAIVDIRMPGMSGLDLCERLQAYSDLPIILLTAVDDEATMVRSIERVADDYVVKPFRPAVLVARVKRLLRRAGAGASIPGPEVRIDERLSLRFQSQEARVAGTSVPLTPTETKLLYVLLRAAPRSVRNAHLLARVWPREEVFEDTLRVHMHRLRQKLEPEPGSPRYLITERGIGYRLVTAPAEAAAPAAPARSVAS
jgi:DNA-binding response OmpR family regulator